jgi:hypothetical protein
MTDKLLKINCVFCHRQLHTAAGSMYWCPKGNTTECPSFHPNEGPDVWRYKNNTYSTEQIMRIVNLKAFL